MDCIGNLCKHLLYAQRSVVLITSGFKSNSFGLTVDTQSGSLTIFTSAHNMTIFSSQANIHPGQTNKMFFYHPRAESWGESINFLYIFISHGTVHRLEHWKILLKVCDNNQLVTDSLMKLTSLPFVREDGLPGVEAEPALQRPFQLDFWSRWSTGVMMVKRRKEIGHRLACPHFPSRCRPRHQVGRR